MFKLLKIPDTILLFKLSLAGLLIYKIFTLKLWIVSDRIFPLVSFSDSFQITNIYFHNIISIISFVVIVILLFKFKKNLLFILVIAELLLLATDVMRWQPTLYQYFLTLIIYLIAPKKFKNYLLLLLSATYLYSGLLKFNPIFIDFNWSKHILVEFIGLPIQYTKLTFIKLLGFIIPVIETLAGILLLTRFRRKGFYLIIITHIFILIFLGKLSFSYSFAVWIWNLIMLLIALVYLFKPKIDKLKINFLTLIWIILIFVLPSLNFFEKYYPYFSFDMYSGDKHVLYINVSLKNNDELINMYNNNDDYCLNEKVTILSYNELGVPVTHNRWLYGRFIKSFARKFPKLEPKYLIQYYPFTTYNIFKI